MDLESEELRKNGLKQKLPRLPFRLLAVIAERNGEVVTYDELNSKFWDGVIVDYKHSLGNAIREIRIVLGDSAKNPRYIETVSLGYRFLMEVTEIARPASRVNGGKKSDTDEFTLQMREIGQELLETKSYPALALLRFRCEQLRDQYAQHSKLCELEWLIVKVRSALQHSAWANIEISHETAAQVFEDPNHISFPHSSNGKSSTLGRVSDTLLVVDHTHDNGSRQGLRIVKARRATPQERRFYEQNQE